MIAKNRNLILGAVLLIVLAVAVTFPLWRPLFINDVVDEAFPGVGMQESFEALPQDQQAVLMEMAADNAEMADETLNAMLRPDVEADQRMPLDEPTVLSTGTFVRIDAIHAAEGSATLYQLPNGSRLLRFEDFRATNGPDLHVYLVKTKAPRNHADLGDDYIDLGSLKGNVGNQNYEIPSDVNVSQFGSVVIYCVPFQVVFSTADLSPQVS